MRARGALRMADRIQILLFSVSGRILLTITYLIPSETCKVLFMDDVVIPCRRRFYSTHSHEVGHFDFTCLSFVLKYVVVFFCLLAFAHM